MSTSQGCVLNHWACRWAADLWDFLVKTIVTAAGLGSLAVMLPKLLTCRSATSLSSGGLTSSCGPGPTPLGDNTALRHPWSATKATTDNKGNKNMWAIVMECLK